MNARLSSRRQMAGTLFFVALVALATGVARAQNDARSEILKMMETYRTAWLAGDGAGVRALFAHDAVLLPHQGDPPVEGLAAIEAYWWPPGAPPTPILEFEQKVGRVEVSGAAGHLWGHSRVRWRQVEGGRQVVKENAGTFVTIFRQEAGTWRIVLQMWDNAPAKILGNASR